MSDPFLLAGVFGFAAGVALRSVADLGFAFSFFAALIGLSLALLCFLFHEAKTRAAILIAAVALFSAGLGMLRFDFADRQAPQTALAQFLGKPAVLEGVLIDEPDERESVTRLIFRVDNVVSAGARIPVLTKALLTVPPEPEFFYGDRLSVFGIVNKPRDFEDKTTLRNVPYLSFLAAEGIYYEMFKPRIEVTGRGQGNFLVAALFSLKRAFLAHIGRLVPEPEAALLGGLLLGGKHSLGKELLDEFRRAGIIHIVVLSGYNITIIAVFIEALFAFLPRKKRFLLSALAISLFAIMVGASATVARATIMALFSLLARGSGRLYSVTRALLIAGFFMLVQNPKILVFDVSFQLSFLSTVGLIYFSPPLESRASFIPNWKRWRLRDITVATFATQAFVLPFLLYKTGLVSIVALPVNLLVLSVIPLTMLMGFLAGLFGFLAIPLALPFAYASYALLFYILSVVGVFARLPFAAFSIPSFPLVAALFCYIGYGFFIWKMRKTPAAGLALPRAFSS